MAEGENLSILQGSDVCIENPCSICLSTKNQSTESTHYCADCGSNLCQVCTQLHNQFPTMTGHQVVTIDQAASVQGTRPVAQLPTEGCGEHNGKILDHYCSDHDQVCCVSCVAQDHRLCKKMEYIPKIAKGTKQSSSLQPLKSSTQALIKEFGKLKLEHQDTLAEVDREEKASMKSLQDVKKDLDKHTDDLVQTGTAKVKGRYQGLRQDIKDKIKTVDDNIQKLEDSKKKLNEFRGDNESQLFVYIKQGEQSQIVCQKVLSKVKESTKIEIPKLIIQETIQENLNAVKSLGEFSETVKLSPRGEYLTVKEGDKQQSSVEGCCLLPDGTLVLSDYRAKCIKYMNASYKLLSVLKLSSEPCDICFICHSSISGACQIAVTLTMEQKVQFVSVGNSLSAAQSFSIEDYCRGICHANGELFICCGNVKNVTSGHIKVYNLSGFQLRDIRTNTAGTAIFSIVNYITICDNNNDLVITDRQQGVIIMDKTGKVKSVIGNSDLKRPTGVCSTENGDLLVCGLDSNSLIQVIKDGTTKTLIYDNSAVVSKPVAICYESARSRVIVTMRDADHITVFDLLKGRVL